jgi:hypothetical protein
LLEAIDHEKCPFPIKRCGASGPVQRQPAGWLRHQRSEGLSSQEFRILYPRKYFDALDPLERREVERRMREEYWRKEGK